MSRAGINAPEHLNTGHDFSEFDSGVPALDEWLKRRTLANEDGGASRTYVLCAAGRVIAYYALAMGDVALQAAVMVLGRLAVDKAYQGRGLGRALLRDAVLRTLQAAALGGIRAILVHAISDEAKRFYASCGFAPSPLDPMMLMITVADAEKALTGQ